jgi:hypothetical protein
MDHSFTKRDAARDDVMPKCDVEKCFKTLSGRPRIGVAAIEKIISITSPIHILNQVPML